MNYSRDPQRSPMQWSDERFAGFTYAKSPWLPIAKDYYSINVQVCTFLYVVIQCYILPYLLLDIVIENNSLIFKIFICAV